MRDQDLFLEQALKEQGLVQDDQLETVHAFASENEVDLVDALTGSKTLDGRMVALIRANICEVPFVDLNDYEPSFTNTRLLPNSFVERYHSYPLFMIDGVLTLAMDDPLNLEATDQARQLCRCEVDAVQCERQPLLALIARAYSMRQYEQEELQTDAILDPIADDASLTQPAVAAVKQLMSDAIEQDASDIHINPDENALHLRYRIDGVLQVKQGPPLSLHPAIVQRLKVMGRLDLTQTKRPQDGKFRFQHGDSQVDVRLSIVPTVCGENVVMRLLKSSHVITEFQELGIPVPIAVQIESLLQQPYGMLLVTGPTGSGKTTTLYTALSKLNDPSRNIMTIENPVEIRLPYVRQIQTHEEIGLTFATALRSILRQDPDVVLVGEIRDSETAKIAMQASLTGHLVLSTLHTNDASGAVDRLRDFGVPPFVINSALLGVVAQRLIRKICDACSQQEKPDEMTRKRFSLSSREGKFQKGKGCSRCGQTGYRGRIGIYELMTISAEIRALIDEGSSIEDIRQTAVAQGMRLMWQDGLDKARLGQTTLLEVSRAATIIDLQDSKKGLSRVSA